MGKYFGGKASASAPKGPLGCGGLSSGHVNDVIGQGCWKVSGQTVIISDTYMSIQAGFECCNYNFRTDTTTSPVPNRLSLPTAVT
jgi:hypothetical protein